MLRIAEAATSHGLQSVRTLFAEYAASLGFDLCFQHFDEERARLPGASAPPDGRLLLALWGDEAAGWVALRKIAEGTCEMKRLCVRLRFRGLHVGRSLAEAVVSEAREIGYSQICLDTTPSMERAGSLYAPIGFKEIEPYYHNPMPGAVFMALAL